MYSLSDYLQYWTPDVGENDFVTLNGALRFGNVPSSLLVVSTDTRVSV
jgi:hypothetical protein